jgi:Holliday junction resolvase RusA-like endonuclease
MPESKTSFAFYQCRYYDDLFGSLNDFAIPTSQTKNKVLKKVFRERILQLLSSAKHDRWPYKERLTIAVGISGNQEYISRIDIDNVLKNLFDILKGIVFVDDKQIYSVMAEKEVNVAHGILIAIRVLKTNETNVCIPPFFSPNEEDGIGNGPTTHWEAVEIKEKDKTF